MPLQEYTRVLRERWWIVVISALFASAVGVAFASSQTPVYRSSVRLEMSGNVDYSQVLAVEKVLRQVGAHVRTGGVAEEVDRRLRLGLGADAILGKIRTQVFADSLLLQVDVDDSDPRRSEQLAAAVGAVTQERQVQAMAMEPAERQINVTVLDRPSPALFVWPQTRSIVTASALMGALAGIVLLLLLEYIDDSVESDADAERYLGLPVLGMIPVESRR